MYTVEIKESAIDSNLAAESLAQEKGNSVEYSSKQEAEKHAKEMSENDNRLRIQRAAPNDPSDADGYLVNHPQKFHQRPKSEQNDWLTFDTGPNLYGEIGRSVVIGSYGVGPSLWYYIYKEFTGITKETHRLVRCHEPYLPDDAPSVSWSPDGLLKVYRKFDNNLTRLIFFEVKTGKASFERGQLEDMKSVAREYDVLKIRVKIDNLPEEYTVKFTRITPEM